MSDSVDLSIPMLKTLQWLKLATGATEYFTSDMVRGCGPNQHWARVWCNLEDYALEKHGPSRRDTKILNQFTNLFNVLADCGVHIRNLEMTNIDLLVLRRVLRPRRGPYCAQLSTLWSLSSDTSVISMHTSDTADGHCRAKTLGKILEEAQNLQTLEWNGMIHYQSRPYLLQCFRPSLPKLSTLSIFGMDATE